MTNYIKNISIPILIECYTNFQYQEMFHLFNSIKFVQSPTVKMLLIPVFCHNVNRLLLKDGGNNMSQDMDKLSLLDFDIQEKDEVCTCFFTICPSRGIYCAKYYGRGGGG